MTKDPYDGINFTKRQATIQDKDGNVIFDKEVEFPDFYSDTSVKIVASKYLCNNAKTQEMKLTDMIDRVSNTITDWGVKDGYFTTPDKQDQFLHDMKYYQIHQYFSFNSPMYFNAGLTDKPQLSACFILSLNDDMESITDWYKNEAQIFKKGSGSGVNLSHLRGSNEKVNGGGTASGPISFLKASDTIAGVIKSGGSLRRSAKLGCLNMSHPDIEKFINCKDKEEEKMRILKAAGIQPELGYEMSDEVNFQNTNISVRIPDAFIGAVKENKSWWTRNVLDDSECKEYNAKELLMRISEHAWKTGDPGVQFHDNINAMNTTIGDGEIEASNPCSEYMAQNDSSCNLASLNLMKFFDDKGNFDHKTFTTVVNLMITAQDIVIDNASYPIDEVSKNTMKYRALGLGFSNLGTLCMTLGYAYNSEDARHLAAAITSYMTGVAYQKSKELAVIKGAPKWWTNKNKRSMYNVLDKHYQSVLDINSNGISDVIKTLSIDVWQDVLKDDEAIRNSQVTLLAPTGTTSFLMGCDTFGIEPEYALVKFKKLSGSDGAMIKTVNGSIKQSLLNLGYDITVVNSIVTDIVERGIPIEKSPHIKADHIAIFDTAGVPENGKRSISYNGHIEMMAAVQPFLSGAISKTINMPEDVTPKDIFNLYMYSWENGLKAVAIYRDSSKTGQPLTSSDKEKDEVVVGIGKRRKLPIDRVGSTHKFKINHTTKGYLTSNVYEDGTLGEVFCKIAKNGSTLSGLVDALFTVVSVALQYGVPLEHIANKMISAKFEPSGMTQNPNIRITSSLVDYIFRQLSLTHLDEDKLIELGLRVANEADASVKSGKPQPTGKISTELCPSCGGQMRMLGSCHFCDGCAFSDGTCG